MKTRKADSRAFRPIAEGVEDRVLTTTGLHAGVVSEVHDNALRGRDRLAERREAILERRAIAFERHQAALEHRIHRISHDSISAAGVHTAAANEIHDTALRDRHPLANRREAILERRAIAFERHQAALERRIHRITGTAKSASVTSEAIRALDVPPTIKPGLGKGLLRITLPFSHTDYGVISIWNNTNQRVIIQVGADTHQDGQLQSFLLLPGRTQSYFAYSTINGDAPVFTVALPGQQPITVTDVNLVFQQNGYFAPAKAGYPYAINIGVNGYYLSYI